ncbi:MAG: hypothetical protein V7K36_25390 [Nostoc sp.]
MLSLEEFFYDVDDFCKSLKGWSDGCIVGASSLSSQQCLMRWSGISAHAMAL